MVAAAAALRGLHAPHLRLAEAPARLPPPTAPCVRDGRALRAIDVYGRWLGPVRDSRVLAFAMAPLTEPETQEAAWMVLLNTHGFFAGQREIARFARDRVGTDFGVAIEAAAVAGSRYGILVHNHPTGDATPSEADAQLTGDMGRAFEVAGMLLLDHVVMGRGQHYSFRERQLWQVSS